MENQSIFQLMQDLPETFVNQVMECEDIKVLKAKLSRHSCYNRRALIQARIDNLMAGKTN